MFPCAIEVITVKRVCLLCYVSGLGNMHLASCHLTPMGSRLELVVLASNGMAGIQRPLATKGCQTCRRSRRRRATTQSHRRCQCLQCTGAHAYSRTLASACRAEHAESANSASVTAHPSRTAHTGEVGATNGRDVRRARREVGLEALRHDAAAFAAAHTLKGQMTSYGRMASCRKGAMTPPKRGGSNAPLQHAVVRHFDMDAMRPFSMILYSCALRH